MSRTLTGAWIETLYQRLNRYSKSCRTLTGAWIETPSGDFQRALQRVAPSRVRGLKRPN